MRNARPEFSFSLLIRSEHVIAPAMAFCAHEGDDHCLVAEVDPLGAGCCYNVFEDQANQPWTDSARLHVVTTNARASGTVRMLGHKVSGNK